MLPPVAHPGNKMRAVPVSSELAGFRVDLGNWVFEGGIAKHIWAQLFFCICGRVSYQVSYPVSYPVSYTAGQLPGQLPRLLRKDPNFVRIQVKS